MTHHDSQRHAVPILMQSPVRSWRGAETLSRCDQLGHREALVVGFGAGREALGSTTSTSPWRPYAWAKSCSGRNAAEGSRVDSPCQGGPCQLPSRPCLAACARERASSSVPVRFGRTPASPLGRRFSAARTAYAHMQAGRFESRLFHGRRTLW